MTIFFGEPLMLRTIVTNGLIAGLIAGFNCLFVIMVGEGRIPLGWSMAVGYTTMLIALSLVFVAIKRRRDHALGGVIRFWPAFGMGLAISAIAGICYALAWEGALSILGGSDAFIDGYIARLRAEGTDLNSIAQMEAMRVSYRNPLFRLPVTFTEIAPVGVLVSLVSAALLRNPRFMPVRRSTTTG